MSDTPDLSETITDAAADPAAASVDGQSATARPIADLVAADQYVASKSTLRARRNGWRCTRQSAATPPGSV